MLVPVSMLLLLTACGPSATSPPGQLPYPPAEFQTCFRGVPGSPDRALTQADVESLMKYDAVREAAKARCGRRLLAWYESLRVNWK